MSQYYAVVNLDKSEYFFPHDFGDGAKLMEFGDSRSGTMLALAILLADGNGRGGGDLCSQRSIVGSWAGDRIVIAGDYADQGKFVPDDLGLPPETTLYEAAQACFANVTVAVMEAMLDDPYLYEELTVKAQESVWSASFRMALAQAKATRCERRGHGAKGPIAQEKSEDESVR